MSSITWKASPSARPKSLIAVSCVGVALALIAPSRTEVVSKRRGFVLVDVTQLRAIDRLAFALEIRDLAGDQLAAAGGDGNLAKNRAQIVARPRVRFGRDLKRDREQRVARQNRDAVAENFVTGRRDRAGNRRYPCSGDRRG